MRPIQATNPGKKGRLSGVPPALEDEEELDSSEESFSITDFESNLSSQDESGSEDTEASIDQTVDDTVADAETTPNDMEAFRLLKKFLRR